MEVSMWAIRKRTIVFVGGLALAFVATIALLGTKYVTASPAASTSSVQPAVAIQVFTVPEIVADTFNTSFVKVGDIATFNTLNPDSVVELDFNGRLFVKTFASPYPGPGMGDAVNEGAIFELRVDGNASSAGIARAAVKKAEIGKEMPASITGIFRNLNPGAHTVSLWVKGVGDGGTDASANPGGWEVDHLVVKEYTPFGYNYLPLIQN